MNKMIVVAMTALLFAGLTSGLLPGTAGHAQAEPGKIFQSANMFVFGTGEDVAGGGTLTRAENEVWVRLATSGLDRGAAYTVWWIIFNNPGECAGDPCAGSDLVDLDVDGSVVYAAGFVTGKDRSANVTAHLDAGALPSGIEVRPVGTGNGLNIENGHFAEIHLVVRSHEDLIVGSVGDQISSFGGGCLINICVDQQAIRFLPVE